MNTFPIGGSIPLPLLVVRNPTSGALEDLTSTPVAADVLLVLNGTITAQTGTCTKLGTGVYVLSLTPSGVVAGDQCAVQVAVTYADGTTDTIYSETAVVDARVSSVPSDILTADFGTISGEAARSLINAARILRNRVDTNAGVITVYKEDGTTVAWTATVTGDSTADPIVTITP